MRDNVIAPALLLISVVIATLPTVSRILLVHPYWSVGWDLTEL